MKLQYSRLFAPKLLKKMLWVFFALLLIGACGIPYWIGKEAEKHLTAANMQFFENPDFKLLDSVYRRGWQTSSAENTFEIRTEAYPLSLNRRFTLRHRIRHGFLPFIPARIHSTLINSDTADSSGATLFSNARALQTHTRINATGKTVVDIDIPPSSIRDGQQALEWQSIQASFTAVPGLSGTHAEIKAPFLHVRHADEQLTLKDLSANISMETGNSGKGTSRAAGISIKIGQQPALELTELRGTENFHVKEGKVTLFARNSIEKLQFGGERFGPGEFDFEMRDMDANSLRKIQTTLADLIRRGVALKDAGFITAWTLMQHGLVLLKNSPEVNITRLRLTTPDGDLTGTLHISVLQLKQSSTNFFELFKAIKAEAQLYVPKVFLYAVAEFQAGNILSRYGKTSPSETEIHAFAIKLLKSSLRPLVQQNYLIQEEKGYRTALLLNAGNLTWNDE
ncbi:MAG: YdgA family protein [Gammaproteobacteria bacterium]|nr:YdgA family protein [Gammaproteobacteria bacterium]